MQHIGSHRTVHARRTVAFGLLALLALAACGDDGEHATSSPAPQPSFCQAPAGEVEARVDALLAQMTLAEKLEQMHGDGVEPLVGGIWQTAANQRLGIPGFHMVDGPRGVSQGTGHATAFPVGMARGATWDPELEERVGATIGAETRAKGGSVLLAPTIAVLRHPRWGRAQETYGEDPLAIGRMGVGFIHGAQRHVIASAKHLALNSIEATRHRVNVDVDERTLREIYLPHFRMAVQDGPVASVMSAYNRVNGQYCGENTHLLHDILKGEWGFQGFVESDWVLGTRSTVASALAGLDIEMPLPLFYGELLSQAVDNGDVPMATIDSAVRRILRTKLCFRLDSNPPQPDASLVESPAHLELAREVARKSIVLLKNAGGILPLDRNRLRSVVVVGRLADLANIGDAGSSAVSPSRVITAADGIRAALPTATVTILPFVTLTDSDRATIAAADAALVVVGTTKDDEGEALDRTTLSLDQPQEDLIRQVAGLTPKTIVVLEGGTAFLVEPWIEDVPALLMAWYPGQEGGHALADLLLGEANPSAKLPITFARSEADLPPFDNRTLRVSYGYYHGYRLLERDAVEPRFGFGFGLSYTTYRYSNLRLSRPRISRTESLGVDCDVTNSGKMAGDEIVQLYVGYPNSAVDRPRHELKGFAKVHLNAGETRRVSFDLRAADLAYYDVDAAAWTVETVGHDVYVGGSLQDLPLRSTFGVTAQ